MKYKRPFPIGLIIGLLVIIAIAVYFFTGSEDIDNPLTNDDTSIESDSKAIHDPTTEIPAIEKPAFDLVRISRGGTGVIAGRMAPGSVVELFANG